MYKITDSCVGCGACAGSCPAGAIVDKDGSFVITDACLDCGACASACPAGAIKEG